MTWEIISRLLKVTTWGGLSHLSDFLIRLIGNNKVKLFFRYGSGVLLVFPAFLSWVEVLLNAAKLATDAEKRRRIMYIVTAAYFLAYVPYGIGVIIAHVLEQILTNAEG